MDCDFQLLLLIVNLFNLNLMVAMPEVTNKDLPFNENHNPLPDFANVGPPYMATLPLLGSMIGLRYGCFRLL